MGYGGNEEYFSSCTIDSVKDFFDNYPTTLQCIGDGVRSFTDDNNDDYDDDDSFEGCSYNCIGLLIKYSRVSVEYVVFSKS